MAPRNKAQPGFRHADFSLGILNSAAGKTEEPVKTPVIVITGTWSREAEKKTNSRAAVGRRGFPGAEKNAGKLKNQVGKWLMEIMGDRTGVPSFRRTLD